MDEMKERMKNLRIVSGEIHGEAEMPVTCAPLISPALDAVAESAVKKEGDHSESVAETLKAKSRDTTKFVNGYFDRRAQAIYAINKPNSILTNQVAPVAPQSKSLFADPNNAINMHLFSLFTGSKYKAEPFPLSLPIPSLNRPFLSILGAKHRWERTQRKITEKCSLGTASKPKERMLSESVIYLMVINMPSEQELEKARKEILEASKKAAE